MATYPSLKSLLAVFCLFALAPALLAQSNTSPNEVPAVTRTILLQNAQVVQAPGQVLDRTSVLIRDGLIEAVGADLAVPFDARVIAADSFRVYAGFIDGLSHTGVPKPKPGETPDIDDPGNPPPDAAGIQPQRDVRTMMDLSEKSIEALRNAGFTTAHVVPHGNLFPGQGAIVNLAGSNVGQMVLAGEASMFSQFEAARRMYPATDLGMMALWRNLYRQADRRQQRADRFSDRPGGLNRPEYDAVRYAFFPVVSGEQPVAFKTESYLDAKRALRLQEELGFQLLLMELKEGWWLTEELADTPVFLSLDLPDAPREATPDSAMADSAMAASEAMDVRVMSHADTDAEMKALEAKRDSVRMQYVRQAATLHEAGVTFGFSTLEAKPNDLRKALQRIVEAGLPEDEALAALTTDAVQMLGLDAALGTVEPGKIANLVVTEGSYFTGGEIRYVFVDGHPFEMEVKKAAAVASADSAGVSAAGEWSYEIDSPQGVVVGTITLDTDLAGTMTNNLTGETSSVSDALVSGNMLTFTAPVTVSGQTMTLEIALEIDGNDAEGSATMSQFGSFPMEAVRSPGL